MFVLDGGGISGNDAAPGRGRRQFARYALSSPAISDLPFFFINLPHAIHITSFSILSSIRLCNVGMASDSTRFNKAILDSLIFASQIPKNINTKFGFHKLRTHKTEKHSCYAS